MDEEIFLIIIIEHVFTKNGIHPLGIAEIGLPSGIAVVNDTRIC
jgi:hypothetical protein